MLSSLEIQFCAVGVEKAEEWMWLESAGFPSSRGIFLPARDTAVSRLLRGRRKSSISDKAVHKPAELTVRMVNLYNNVLTGEWSCPFTRSKCGLSYTNGCTI
jgi:EAL domain-containing protein (putative c-di-GMP-specific phosphodiesterase class I)